MGLYLLIPLSVVIVFIIGVIFWWSVRSGQFDDMEGPAYKMLMDDRDQPARARKQPDDSQPPEDKLESAKPPAESPSNPEK